MAKHIHRYVLQLSLAFGLLMCMTGCDSATALASPVDLSTSSSDLVAFVQQLTREVLAAFLF